MNLYTQTKGRIVGNEVVDKSIQEASDTVKYVSDWTEDIGDEYFSWLKYNPAC